MADPTAAARAEEERAIAGNLGILLATLGAVESVYPGKFKLVTAIVHATPVVNAGMPLLVTLLGAVIASASKTPGWLRWVCVRLEHVLELVLERAIAGVVRAVDRIRAGFGSAR